MYKTSGIFIRPFPACVFAISFSIDKSLTVQVFSFLWPNNNHITSNVWSLNKTSDELQKCRLTSRLTEKKNAPCISIEALEMYLNLNKGQRETASVFWSHSDVRRFWWRSAIESRFREITRLLWVSEKKFRALTLKEGFYQIL